MKLVLSLIILILISSIETSSQVKEEMFQEEAQYIAKWHTQSSQWTRCTNLFYNVKEAGRYPDGELKCKCLCKSGVPRYVCCVMKLKF
jgi:hypothetical protein